jgi:heterotetrameric sarcosine oxidase delta subunit
VLLIECPFCGARPEIEFHWGGESHVARPAESASDAEWSDYLFFHANRKGVNFERWHHEAGCRRWFNVARDTVSHAVLAVYPMGAAKPDLAR